MVTGFLTPSHIAILLVVALLILGPKQLPGTGRALGSALREFKDGIAGRDDRTTSPTEALTPGPLAPTKGKR
jgi:sec-independent protein translocase protein TatA